MTDVEVAIPDDAELAESPVWDERLQCLWWTDVLRGAVLRYDVRTGARAEHVIDSTVSAALLHEGPGTLLLAAGTGFSLLDLDSGESTQIAAVEVDQPDTRMNDAKVDSAGRVWGGTMSVAGRPRAGSLYRLDAGRVVSAIQTRITVSNGLGWSPDGRWMYHIDSPTKMIRRFAFDMESGRMDQPRVLIDASAYEGTPDGMTVDADGGIWVCFWGGSAIRRYDDSGRILAEVRLPVTKPTSCCFGGPRLADMFITTARYRLSTKEISQQPYAGSVLRIDPGVTGLSSARCNVE